MTDQAEMFPQPERPAHQRRSKTAELPAGQPIPWEDRAGTRIYNHEGEPMYVMRGKGRQARSVYVGTFSEKHKVYQYGSTEDRDDRKPGISGLVYWRERLVPLGPEEWNAIVAGNIQWIEMLDIDESVGRNRCYRISVEEAEKAGHWFDGGIGQRWGIPFDLFHVYGPGWVPL